ncbi:MAG TPA: iron-sulfur cluster assembly scaffold protein [Gemmatimonadaceae bacterium]|nr:iron-sulfur cluster assembly scaffold protein [Gemmatimonadaceae bacterium]
MTAFRAVVLEHFRRPRNRGPLENATSSVEGSNPLCGDRIRVQLRVDGERVAEARFTADACAICIAAASMLTEHAHGLRVDDALTIDLNWLHGALDGEPPAARRRCVALPLDTFHRALAEHR